MLISLTSSENQDIRAGCRHLWKGNTMAESWVSVEKASDCIGVAKDSVYLCIEAKGLLAHQLDDSGNLGFER
jgi:hypothetical protein